MKRRMEEAEQQYRCKKWSEKYASAKWQYAFHLLDQSPQKWARWIIAYSHRANEDEESPYIPHRYPGRPRLRWDDIIQDYCTQKWPERSDETWFTILSTISAASHEEDFGVYYKSASNI